MNNSPRQADCNLSSAVAPQVVTAAYRVMRPDHNRALVESMADVASDRHLDLCVFGWCAHHFPLLTVSLSGDLTAISSSSFEASAVVLP
jgi:hypothetical protein